MCISSEAMETKNMTVKLGSIENTQGEVWDHLGKTEVAEIFISYGDVIDFVQFLYVENGCLDLLSDRPGSTKLGRKFTPVKLNYPDEFLTSISGTYGNYFGRSVMTSITFVTNHGTHGPYGKIGEWDTVFHFEMGQDRESFGGFHGSSIEGVLESIGVYVKPTTTLQP